MRKVAKILKGYLFNIAFLGYSEDKSNYVSLRKFDSNVTIFTVGFLRKFFLGYLHILY